MDKINLKFLIIGVVLISMFMVGGSFIFSLINKQNPPQQTSSVIPKPYAEGGGKGGKSNWEQ